MNVDRSLELTVAVHGAPRTLHALVREEAGQIGKEALANAFHHSSASRIEVEVSFERSRLLVRVRDNGVGIDQQTLETGKPGHFGIGGMSERAKRIHAEFKIWSSEGAGAEVNVIVPARIAYVDFASDNLWRRLLRLMRPRV